mgnify:CR=1 FL=1
MRDELFHGLGQFAKSSMALIATFVHINSAINLDLNGVGTCVRASVMFGNIATRIRLVAGNAQSARF